MIDHSALTPHAFVEELLALGLRRVAFIQSSLLHPAGQSQPSGALESTHPKLDDLAQAISGNARDFNDHQAVFLEIGEQSGALLGAFLHRTRRGQAIGGVRLWSYETVGSFLEDGVRLSLGMGRKNALAGLWWGGGKGVIARPPGHQHTDPAFRMKLFQDYGRFITSLCGAYIAAENAGTTPEDMATVYGVSRFVVCVPESVGGSGNPSPATARGVICAMEGALDHLGLGDLRGKVVAMQGVGNVGGFMLPLLLERGVERVVAADTSEEIVRAITHRHPAGRVEIRHVAPGDGEILAEPCDILAPNALGGVLNPASIPRLAARIVCGAANNQLLDAERDAQLLADHGITYVPDFVANRMGIVNSANEQYGRLPDDPMIARHFDRKWEGSVYRVTRAVLARAESSKMTSSSAAIALADELAEQPHPIFPDRGGAIIRGLIEQGWPD